VTAVKLKIAYVLTGLRLGGAETQVLLLAKTMKKNGAEVTVIAMESGGVMVNKFKAEGIEVVELGIKSAKELFSGYNIFKSVIAKLKPDVIHSHMVHANMFCGVFKFFNFKYKVVATAHNIQEGSKLLMAGYYFTKYVVDWSTNVSVEAYQHYLKEGYFSRKKSSYVPNGIDTDLFRPNDSLKASLRQELSLSDQDYVILAAGRLHAQKNHQMLIEAFGSIREQLPGAKVLIAGDGELRSELQQLIMRLNLNDSVKLLGNRNDIVHLLNLCDCFVLSSTFEGFGLVVAEALSCCKAVIATDCGGVKEVLNNYGLLIEKQNVAVLTSALLKLYKQPFTSERLIKAREYIITKYSINNVVNTWVSLYSK
jgi:glycosyltransferase involved in cell wall biosynthesis